MKTALVTTTIYIPEALAKYAANVRQHGHENVEFIVIGDRKTPAAARDVCRRINTQFPCEYLDVNDQREYLERFPHLWAHLPFDSIQRRNYGMLRAWEHGADVIITIDDDNLLMNHDYVRAHHIAGSIREVPCIESSTGWFNICSMLNEENNTAFYPRGYPLGERWREVEGFTSMYRKPRRIAVNAGLWLDDPDIDALTRLNRPLVVRGLRSGTPATFALEPGTWSPFNSQNTAIARDVIPAYFLSPNIGRYDDIWAGYTALRCIEHLGHVVAYGDPIVRQKRHPHDIWKDLDRERTGMLLTDSLCAGLRSMTLTGRTYHDCFGEIARGLPDAWQPEARWTDAMREMREKYMEGLAIWHETFVQISTESKLKLGKALSQSMPAQCPYPSIVTK